MTDLISAFAIAAVCMVVVVGLLGFFLWLINKYKKAKK